MLRYSDGSLTNPEEFVRYAATFSSDFEIKMLVFAELNRLFHFELEFRG